MSQTRAQLISDLVQALAFSGTSSAPEVGLFCGATNEVALATDSTARLTVDADGRVLVGTTSTRTNFGSGIGTSPALQIEGTSASTGALGLIRNADSVTASAYLQLAKTRGTSKGSNTIVQDDDRLGYISFSGANGSNLVEAAGIESFVDGTPFSSSDATDMPGRLVFSTTADGAGTPTERMRIDSSGVVNVGTTTSSPGTKFNIANGSDAANIFAITGADTVTEYIALGIDSGVPTITAGGFHSTSTSLAFRTASSGTETERMRIDSSGRLLIGLTTARQTGSGFTAFSQIEGANTISAASLSIISNRDVDDLGARLNFARSKGGSDGSSTVVDNNAELGGIYFWGADGTDLNTQGAEIIAEVDGTPGSDDMPTRLVFGTTADGGSSPTERMRIDSSGNVGIGTTSPSNSLHIHGSSPSLRFSDTDANGSAFSIVEDNAGVLKLRCDAGNSGTGSAIAFDVDASEQMRIDSSGNVGIGTGTIEANTNYNTLEIAGDTDSGGGIVRLKTGDRSTAKTMLFCDTGGFEARVETNHPAVFSTNNAERMRIDSSGLLGVGVSSPVAQVQINSHKNAETDKQQGGNYHLFLKNSEDDTGEAIGLAFSITSNATAVGAAILHERDGGGSQGSLQFLTNGGSNTITERLRITNGGQLQSHSEGDTNLKPMQGCRAFCCFKGTGTISIFSSFNVSSITDVSTGSYLVNFSTAPIDADYGVTTGFQRNGTADEFINVGFDNTTARVKLEFFAAGSQADCQKVTVAVFR